jgi:AcrR family transcriptional regulator
MKKDENKRRAIMRAAENLFLGRRFHEVTLDEVAGNAKVGKGTIYLYFKDKDDLFFQTAVFGLEELTKIIREHGSRDLPFKNKVQGICETLHQFSSSRRPMILIMHEYIFRKKSLSREYQRGFEECRMKIDTAVSEALSEGVAKGFIRPDINIIVLAQFLLGMMQAHGRAFHENLKDAPDIPTVVEIFLHGVEPKSSNKE